MTLWYPLESFLFVAELSVKSELWIVNCEVVKSWSRKVDDIRASMWYVRYENQELSTESERNFSTFVILSGDEGRGKKNFEIL